MLQTLRTILIWLVLLVIVLFGYANWKIWRTEAQLERYIARTLAPTDTSAGIITHSVQISLWSGEVRVVQPQFFKTSETLPGTLRDITLHLGRSNSLKLGLLPVQYVLMQMDTIRITATAEDAFFAEVLLTENPIYGLVLLSGDLRPERPVRLTMTLGGLKSPNSERISAAISAMITATEFPFSMAGLQLDMRAASDITRVSVQVQQPAWRPSSGALGEYEAVLQIFGVPTQQFDFSGLEIDFELTPDQQIATRAYLRHYAFTATLDAVIDATQAEAYDATQAEAHDLTNDGSQDPTQGEGHEQTDVDRIAVLKSAPISGSIRIDQMIEPLDNAIYNVERLFRLSLRRDGDAVIFNVSGTLLQPRVNP
jgi:hypothetical protein